MITQTSISDQVKTFYASLFAAPVDTLKTAWRGAVSGETEGKLAHVVPTNAGLGILCMTAGVAGTNPFIMGVGALSLTLAASHWHDLGLHLDERENAPLPPAP